MVPESGLSLFVSHHSSKLDVAEHVEKALRRRGIKCWIAPRDVEPGDPFDKAIRVAIDKSTAVLLLFCARSEKSRHVKRELILADNSAKPIIPLRLEAIDPGELAYFLADSQWIDWIEKRDYVIDKVAAQVRQYSRATALVDISADEIPDDEQEIDANLLKRTIAGTGEPRLIKFVLMSSVLLLLIAAAGWWFTTGGDSRVEQSDVQIFPTTFGCDSDTEATEMSICRNRELAEREVEVSGLYDDLLTEVTNRDGNRGQVVDDQRAFLRLIIACQGQENCITRHQIERAAALENSLAQLR